MRTQGAGTVVAAALSGFVVVIAATNPAPVDLSGRVPEQQRLASLIRVEQDRSARLRSSAADLRTELVALGRRRTPGDRVIDPSMNRARSAMGLVTLAGPGLVVTLDDSEAEESPSGNLNDIVIHSQDVQAVANGLWAAGAEALSVSGQRVVPTSALLCVGNTLLINGTVHSPPYRFAAIGESLREPFLSDPLVERFGRDAERFSLGFSVEERDDVKVPAYRGTTAVQYAQAG